MHNDTLDPIQYEDIYHENDLPFRDGSQRVVTRLIRFGLGLFAFLVLASFLVRLPREINLPFELKGGQEEAVFQYPEVVYIKQRFKQLGDSVQTGDTLLAIGSQSISQGISHLEAIGQKLEFFGKEQLLLYRAALEQLQTERACVEAELKSKDEELRVNQVARSSEKRYLEEMVLAEEANHLRNLRLFDSGYVSQRELELSANAHHQSRKNLAESMATYDITGAGLQSSLQSLRNRSTLIVKDMERIRIQRMADSVELNQQYQQALGVLASVYGKYTVCGNSLCLLSPFTGRISYLSGNESEVPSREILLKIDKARQAYYVFAEASTAQVGQMKVGNRVVLKYHSFPYYYYGTMRSSIDAISLSANEDGNYAV